MKDPKKKAAPAKKQVGRKKAVSGKKSTPAAKKKTVSKTTSTSKAYTTIIADIDIGWGNTLYIRGEGGPLSWDKGVIMENVHENRWAWKTHASSGLEFKFLINDEHWSQGDNLTVAPGSTSISKPCF